MKLPFFLRKKSNEVANNQVNLKEVLESSNEHVVINEKEQYLNEFNHDDLQYFFSVYNLDKDSISLSFADTLKANPDLFNYLINHFVEKEIVQKINNKSLSIHDLKKYDKGLLQFDIFIDEDRELLDILRKDINVSSQEYACFTFEDYQQKINNPEIVEVKIPSFVDEPVVIDQYSSIRLNRNNVSFDNEINVAMSLDSEKIFADSNDIFNYYYSGDITLNPNSILFIPYRDFLEWSKDDTKRNLLKSAQVVIKDDLEKVIHLSYNLNWFYQNFHTSLFINNNDMLVSKVNHLLYLINNSELTMEDKAFFQYHVTKTFQDMNKRFRVFMDEQNLKMIALELQSKLDSEKIQELTTLFNQLNKEEKLKEVERPKFSVDVFLRQFKDLDSLSSFDFLNHLDKLNKDEKKEVLANELAIQKLQGLLKESARDEYRYYEKFINLLDIDELFSIFDANFIISYYKNNKDQNEYRFFYQILEKDVNRAVEYFLTDDKYFEEFLKDISNFGFGKLEYSLLVKMLKKIENSKLNNNLPIIGAVSEVNQFKLLKEDFSDEMLVKIVKISNKNVQQFFYLEDNRFHYLYDKFNILDLAVAGYKISDVVANKKEFFDKFKSTSIIQFRANVNQLMIHQPSIFFEEKVLEYEKELISNYDLDSGLFQQYQHLLENIELLDNRDFIYHGIDYFYTSKMNYEIRQFTGYDDNDNIYIKDKDKMVAYLQELSKQKLNEVIVDLLFKDNIYNVFLNLKEMLRFSNELKDDEKVLDDGQIKFYETILKLDHLDKEVILDIYNKFKDKNVALMFYEDLQKVKNKCYDKIKSELFQPEEMINQEDKEKSLKYGIPVYDLRDKEYVILARCLGNSYEEDTHHKRDCYTLLSNENSDVINRHGFIYGYSGFDNDCVLHMFEGDSFSGDVKWDELNAGSNRVNRMMTSQEIATNSYMYSEVQIVNKKNDGNSGHFEALRPSFLIVYDEINQEVLDDAKKKNIPICIISHQRNKTLENQIPFHERLDKYIHEIWVDNEDERSKHR